MKEVMVSHKAEMDNAISSLKEDLEPSLARSMATAMEKVATSTELRCNEALGELLAQTGPANDELRLQVESGIQSVAQMVQSLKASVDEIKARHQLRQGSDRMATLRQDANVQAVQAVEMFLVPETFDSEFLKDGISLSSSGTVATRNEVHNGYWSTVYGQTGVSQGKWEWKLEILDARGRGGRWKQRVVLGIVDSDGWGGSPYASSFTTGDVVSVVLDMSTRKLSFKTNGTDLGVSHEVRSREYYLAVSMRDSGQKVRIKSCQKLV